MALLTATLRSAAPLVFAAMGGLLSERSGITNIGLEGFMLMGAFAAVAGTWFSGNPFVGLAVAMLTGGIGAAVFAFWAISLRADQIVAGTAIVLLGLGLTSFLTEQIWGQAGGSPTVQRLPTLGAGLNILIPVAYLLVPLTHWFLFKTRAGLRVMACGEHPAAAQSVGIAVARYRYAMVITSGVLAAVGGAYLSIGDLSQFSTNMTAGRGFIALAAVIFGNWMPWGTLGAALLFGFAQALRFQVQALDLPISQDIIIALPYLLTLIAVTGLLRKSAAPAGLGKHATDH
ncbi:MAG: ABC transporter permease [Thermomicrobiales bacterium]|nr:ABC transporter permease [Thermomicrobiales bacterium]MCA9880560.1 ABC transporter permease [Thermomicrobiales bacterium]